MADRKIMTEMERRAAERLAHPLYTAEFLEEWINRSDSVFANAPSALQSCLAKGFYEAVRLMAKAEEKSWLTRG